MLLAQREEVLREDVASELPQLKRNIARAKRLHSTYEVAHSRAEAAEKRARTTDARYAQAERALSGDTMALREMRATLRSADRGVGDELKESYERDWKSLREMHEELITDKEGYEKARESSCAHGGPCPQAASSGLPSN